MSENTDSDLKQLQSSSTTENQQHSQTNPHRKTPLEAYQPMHICDARNKRREVGDGGGGGSRSRACKTDINHEDEFHSTASASNSIERHRSPNNISRATPTQTTPSPSSSASREGM